MDHLTIRYAQESDIPKILYFIKELAIYENMLDDVVATKDLLREWIFEKQKAEVLLAEEDGIPVGFALFFHNFSTFLGRAGIYLEDLFVMPEHRGKGYGQSPPAALGPNHHGAGLRQAGMGLPELEQAQHRLLPLPGCHAHGSMNRLSPHRGRTAQDGGGLTVLSPAHLDGQN